MGRTGEVSLSAGNNPQQSGVSPVGEQTENLGCPGEIYRAQPYPRFSFHLCGTNHTYLSRFLKETHGVNFSEWVSGLRVSKAKELMRKNPKDKLENVAYLSGFSSLSYFSKVFSHLEGVSPARWRDSMSL